MEREKVGTTTGRGGEPSVSISYAYAIFCDGNNLRRIDAGPSEHISNLNIMQSAIQHEIGRHAVDGRKRLLNAHAERMVTELQFIADYGDEKGGTECAERATHFLRSLMLG